MGGIGEKLEAGDTRVVLSRLESAMTAASKGEGKVRAVFDELDVAIEHEGQLRPAGEVYEDLLAAGAKAPEDRAHRMAQVLFGDVEELG